MAEHFGPLDGYFVEREATGIVLASQLQQLARETTQLLRDARSPEEATRAHARAIGFAVIVDMLEQLTREAV